MKKIRILLVLGVCLMNINLSYAEPYIGVNAGANITTISKNISYLQTTSDFSDKINGFRGQALIGYNIHFMNELLGMSGEDNNSDRNDEFYFAIEAGASYNSGNASENISPWFLTTDASVKENMQNTLDIFILPKYRMNPNIIFFAGPGFVKGHFKTSSSETAGNIGVTGDYSEMLSGWSAKAGIEVPIDNFFNIVAVYQYAYFNSVTWSSVEPLTGQTVSAKYRPVMNSLSLGINFII